MRKLLWFLLFALPIAAQVSNPSIINVTTAPSGTCAQGLPNRQVISTGTQYSCQNVTAGVGTWGMVGAGAGGPPTGTASGVLGRTYPDPGFASTAANLVAAGPVSGSPAAATFRGLVAADIPSLSSIYLPLAGGMLANNAAIAFQGTGAATTLANLGAQPAGTYVTPTTLNNGTLPVSGYGLGIFGYSSAQVIFATGFIGPQGLAFDVSGNLYVANSGSGTVLKVTSGGSVTTFATGFSGPIGLAFDTSGNLYVANSGSNTVLKVTSGGGVTTFATGFSGPVGLAFDTSGNLYVANSGSGTVSKIDSPLVLNLLVSLSSSAPGVMALPGVLINGVVTTTNTDQRGKITLSGGTGSYTFTQGPIAGAWTTPPICIIQDDTTLANLATSTKTVTASSITITGSVGTSDVYSYLCQPGN